MIVFLGVGFMNAQEGSLTETLSTTQESDPLLIPEIPPYCYGCADTYA